jgi:hypothetical protein
MDFGLDSRLFLKHHAALFGRPFIPRDEMNSGENSNSVGGVPVDIRTRIADFVVRLWFWLGFPPVAQAS